MIPLEQTAGRAAARLRHWLLHGPAQLREGEHSGGVAGTLAADGRPRYVYAEITGYYLSWLADIAADADAALVRSRAALAMQWATRAFAAPGQAPPTRLYLAAAEPDWRNDALFFFDLAMLVRGIDAAVEAGVAPAERDLRERLHTQLAQFVQGDRLCCAIQLRGTHALPPRWSTRGGPFLVKASSRIAYGARHAALHEPLARACANDSAAWATQAAAIDLDMLHPTLYFAEGLLLSRPDCTDAVASLLQRCLAQRLADGSLPETAVGEPPARAGKVRNDILAQALRVGILLQNLDAHGAPAQAQLDRLAATLLERIGDNDYLAFNADSADQANVWCTMFAEQALRWYATAHDAHAPRPGAAALV
jgi:hypothetical protein